MAADGTWDDRENAVMHGAVAWRNKLLGWRGLYWCDALGQPDLLRKHLSNWLPKQNVDPIPPRIPVAEESANLSRNETALHSNGAMSFGHYDMNRLDGNPIIDRCPEVPNFILAAGFSGHGLQHATAVGRALKELILDGGFRSIDLTRLAYRRVVENAPLPDDGPKA